MNTAETLKHLDSLIARGEAFRLEFQEAYLYRWYRYSTLDAEYSIWRDEALRLANLVLGADSETAAAMAGELDRFSSQAPASAFTVLMDGLMKAREAFLMDRGLRLRHGKEGFLAEMLARAREMADRGHLAGAVTLGGAVLDESLRRLCAEHGLFCAENARLASLNDKLCERGVYDSAWHAEIVSLLELRRTAEQSGLNGLTTAEAAGMLEWLDTFLAGRFTPGGAYARGQARG